jgi:cobalt-precorrin 5A hydrolase
MIAAGIGTRSIVTVEQVDAAIAAALLRSSIARISMIAVPSLKGSISALRDAAAARQVPLLLISQLAMEAASPRTLTRSELSMALMNVPSVAEAVALAAAGPNGRLIAPRLIMGPVTCALADSEAVS